MQLAPCGVADDAVDIQSAALLKSTDRGRRGRAKRSKLPFVYREAEGYELRLNLFHRAGTLTGMDGSHGERLNPAGRTDTGAD